MRFLALPLASTCLILLVLTGCSDQIVATTDVGITDPNENAAIAFVPDVSPSQAETIKATPAFVENQEILRKFDELFSEIEPAQMEEWEHNPKGLYLFLEEFGYAPEDVRTLTNDFVKNKKQLDDLFGIDHHVVAVFGSIDEIASGAEGVNEITPCEEACNFAYERQLLLNDIEYAEDLQNCDDVGSVWEFLMVIPCVINALGENHFRDDLAALDRDACIADCAYQFTMFYRSDTYMLKEPSDNYIGLQRT